MRWVSPEISGGLVISGGSVPRNDEMPSYRRCALTREVGSSKQLRYRPFTGAETKSLRDGVVELLLGVGWDALRPTATRKLRMRQREVGNYHSLSDPRFR